MPIDAGIDQVYF